MEKTRATVDSGSDLKTHPAVEAWRRLGGIDPSNLQTVKKGRHGRAVYRLTNVGPRGTAVIAKRRQVNDKYRAERIVYEQILPGIASDHLHYYGAVEENGGGFGWLFVQEALAERYSPHLTHHRVSAGHWLGVLHTRGPQCAGVSSLPESEPYPSPGIVTAARDPIHHALSDSRFRGHPSDVLHSILTHLRAVESQLPYIEDLCRRTPRTVVHGDFVARNLCIRESGHETQLLSLDCEGAAWGSPLLDLLQSQQASNRSWASADTEAYWSVVRGHWPNVDFAAVRDWAACATILRCLSVITWDAPQLASTWPEKALDNLAEYEVRLAQAIDTVGWR